MKETSLKDVYNRIEQSSEHEEFVWGSGDLNADIMLIGEAPGKEEIKCKKPFCGAAGANLTEFLKVLDLARDEIFITNACKFRPTKTSAKGTVSNRTTTRTEVSAAQPFLYEEIEIIDPKIIVTLGNTALYAVSGDPKLKIGDVHGKIIPVVIEGKTYSLFALYHPASIIYNRSLKDAYYRDLEKLKSEMRRLKI